MKFCQYSTTETNKKACTWLRELCSCSCLTALPGLAWVLLSKIYISLCSPLYNTIHPSEWYVNLPLLKGVIISDANWTDSQLPKQVLFWRGKLGLTAELAKSVCFSSWVRCFCFPSSQFSLCRCPIRGRRIGYPTGLQRGLPNGRKLCTIRIW